MPSRASPELGFTEVQGQYIDPTSGLAFLHRAWKRLSGQHASHRSVAEPLRESGGLEKLQKQKCAGDKPLESDDGGSLPIFDLDTALDLVDFYFDVCIATYRFLHRPTVIEWLRHLLQNADRSLPLSHRIGEMKASIVLTVLAIAVFHQGKSKGSRLREEADLAIRRSDRLFTAATRLADTATGYPALESVQAKLGHTLYLLHSSRMNQAWYVFGEALQTIAAMGLHRKTSRARPMAHETTPADYIDSQCRRRSFWVAYTLDIYLGVILGRPRHYHDETIDQEFPDAINDENMTSTGPQNWKGQKDCTSNSLEFHAR